MSFISSLRNILLLLKGLNPPAPTAGPTTTTPQPKDSKETLAAKWEKKLRQ